MHNVKDKVRMLRGRLFVLIFVYALSSGCATIIKGTTQGIPISSDPVGANILVDGVPVGTTPADVELKRKRDHLVVIELDGYQPKSMPVVKNVGGAVWGNIIAGGLIGWGVDAASGAQNNLTPKTIFVKLTPVGEGGGSDSGQNSSVGITKLNELDMMRDNKQISDDEYTAARVALIRQYFPEMIPPEDEAESSDEAAEESDP